MFQLARDVPLSTHPNKHLRVCESFASVHFIFRCRRMVGPPLHGDPRSNYPWRDWTPLGSIILGYLDPSLGGWTPDRRASRDRVLKAPRLHPSSLASSLNSWALGTKLPSSHAQLYPIPLVNLIQPRIHEVFRLLPERMHHDALLGIQVVPAGSPTAST